MIHMDLTAGAIYVVRNPLDVCLSVADHYGASVDEAIRMMNDMSSGDADQRPAGIRNSQDLVHPMCSVGPISRDPGCMSSAMRTC